MSIFDEILGTLSSSLGVGRMSLADATKNAPNSMGCYQIFLNGSLKYVGKAEDGLRKRFVQYYNGTTAHYPSAQMILAFKDKISVTWVVCNSREQCRQLEAKWIREKKPEWNAQSGWGGY